MDNNVVLTLRMEQLDSEDGDGIINTYPAKYRKVGDWHVFSYEETVSSDPGDRTKNLLKIRDEEVILIKKGTINSTMEFRNDDVFRSFANGAQHRSGTDDKRSGHHKGTRTGR